MSSTYFFSAGTFPERLQVAKVVLFKGGDKNLISNYRPISILPIFSKCVEKLIHERMTNFLNKHRLITPCQFGFRKGCSTETALLSHKEYILLSFEQQLYTLGIFVYYSKAFDCIIILPYGQNLSGMASEECFWLSLNLI